MVFAVFLKSEGEDLATFDVDHPIFENAHGLESRKLRSWAYLVVDLGARTIEISLKNDSTFRLFCKLWTSV